jgi:hypothetical protein
MKVTEGRVRVAASDVANFLACQQLTQLDLQAARRTLRSPAGGGATRTGPNGPWNPPTS